jgi:ACS family glucarate transporter-like MFS transporter
MGRYRYWLVFLLFSGTFINSMDRGSLAVAAPSIMKEMSLDPAVMGVVLSSFFWAYFVMQIPSGFMADKFGVKRTLGWSAFVWSFLTAVTGVANSFIQLVACRIGVGMGEAALQPCNVKVAKGSFPTEQRATVIGIYNAGMRLGLAVVPILMVFLMAAFDWRVAFYVTGGISLLWVALWFFTFREAKPEPNAPGCGCSDIPWWKLLKHRSIIGIVLCKFFQDYLYNMFITWLPAYLVMERGFTILKMGWYASLPWIVTFLALPLVGLLSDTLIKRGMSVTKSRKGMIVVGQVIAASVIIAVYTDNAMIAMFFLVVALVFESGSSTVLWSVCAEISPPNATACVGGIMNTAGALSGIVAPIVTGLLLKFTGNFQQAFLIASVFIVFAALSMWFIVGKIEQIQLDDNVSESKGSRA